MCQFSGTILQARQKKSIKKQKKLTWATILFSHVLNWRELKSVRAVSKFNWPLLHKYSPSLHLGEQSPGRRAIGGFGILRRSAKCTRRPNIKAARIIGTFTSKLGGWDSCRAQTGTADSSCKRVQLIRGLPIQSRPLLCGILAIDWWKVRACFPLRYKECLSVNELA